MLRSMFAGVSGLRSHQVFMDVIGNNIANVNTTGYKAGSVVFQDLLSQMVQGAGAPQGTIGGTNAAQVGLGVRLGGISTSFTQGSTQLTGRPTDLAIQGDGFFVVQRDGEQLFTRMGAFSFDANGRLVTPDGAIVQGWAADAAGVVNPQGAVGDLTLPLGQLIQPSQTSTMELGGNLPADAEVGDTATSTMSIFDAQGAEVPVTFVFEKVAADQWEVRATAPNPEDPDAPIELLDPAATLTFDPVTGLPDTSSLTLPGATLPGQWDGDVTVSLGEPGDATALVQFAGSSSLASLSQDGAGIGFLRSFSISADGTVSGVFSNGLTRALGQIAMASFNNPAGLERTGSTLFRAGANSGQATLGQAGEGGLGTVAGGALEMSNVDLAQEFTNLITAQRGFQANSRIISASDEILQDLVNLKR